MPSLITNTAIVVDSACDLPPELLQQRGIFVLPIGFNIGEKHFSDRRVPQMLSEFNCRRNFNAAASIQTTPPCIDTIRDFIITNIVEEFENLLIMCISSTRSEIYKNASEAVRMLPEALCHSHPKTQTKLKNIEVIDTLSVFSGQGLLAHVASELSLIDGGAELGDLVETIREHSNCVSTYVIPNNLAYLKNRGTMRNERCIGGIDYLVAQTFGLRPIIKWQCGKSMKDSVRKDFDSALTDLCGIACDAISHGLKFDSIMVSYSGDIDQFKQCERYTALAEYARSNHVALVLSTMSITAGVYLGPGAVSLSFCQ